MMTRSDCNLLNDCLAGDLPDSTRATFQEHLASCDECREAVRVHAVIAGRLREGVAAENLPPLFIAEVERRRIARWRRRWLATVAALAASVLGVAVALNWKPKTGDGTQDIAQVPMEPAPVRIAFQSDVLAVEVPVSEPGITALWVYPAVNRTRTESNEFNQLERNGR